MESKVVINITHVYGPGDEVPGWSSDTNNNSNNYGSGTGDLTVNDLNKDTTGNSNNSSLPNVGGSDKDHNTGNGNESSGTGSAGGDGDSNNGADSSENGDGGGDDKNNPFTADDGDEGSTNPFLDKMNKILDDAFQTLTPSTPNIMLETAKGTLNIRTKSNPVKNPIEIATKVATYFSLTIVPKPMGVAGPVTACSNNAMSIVPKLTQDLIKLSQSGKADNYEGFVQTLYDNIANGAIVWNVVETIPGSPPVTVPYAVTVT